MKERHNYSRESCAKDAFSLWEHENRNFVSSMNAKIETAKDDIFNYVSHGDCKNNVRLKKLLDSLENCIVELHCAFEDWCFESNT